MKQDNDTGYRSPSVHPRVEGLQAYSLAMSTWIDAFIEHQRKIVFEAARSSECEQDAHVLVFHAQQ